MSDPFENEDSIKLHHMRDPEPTTESDPRMHMKLRDLRYLSEAPLRIKGECLVMGPKLAGTTFKHE